MTVQNRLPGYPLTTLDGRLLEEVLQLVERQADAAIPADDRDFTSYIANVLFDDWDQVWADAARAGEAAGPLCARIRRWLQPAWGLRLPQADYAHNDLNLSNILTDGEKITGVVDWDEFGLGSRALDLIALALDCQQHGAHAAAGGCWPGRHRPSAVQDCAAWSATAPWPGSPRTPGRASHRRPRSRQSRPSSTDSAASAPAPAAPVSLGSHRAPEALPRGRDFPDRPDQPNSSGKPPPSAKRSRLVTLSGQRIRTMPRPGVVCCRPRSAGNERNRLS